MVRALAARAVRAPAAAAVFSLAAHAGLELAAPAGLLCYYPRMRRLLLILLALGLSSCSLFVPKLEKPTLSIVGVQLLKSDLWHQELRVRLRVQNPNDRALPVKGIIYELDVEGQELAHGLSGDSFVVPALGEAEFDMSVSANMASLLFKLLNRSTTQVEYRIYGKISLSAGLLRSIKFDDHGTFRFQ